MPQPLRQFTVRASLCAFIVSVVAFGTTATAQTVAQTPAADTAPQAPAAPPDGQLPRVNQNVEVTATRGTVDIDRAPASSTVLTRSDIEQRNATTVDQALGEVPGVATYRLRGLPDNGVGLGMRGFSGRSSGEARILVLFDGQPINDSYLGSVNWTAVPVDEVDRVEVVRGPFSALYGGNAMGGVINVLSRPVERRAFEAAGQYGSFTTGTLTSRYADRFFGRLGVSVAYNHLRTGGYASQVVLRTATDSTAAGGVQVTGPDRFATTTGGVNYAVGLRGDNRFRQDNLHLRGEYAFGPRTFGVAQYLRQTSETGWGTYHSQLRDAAGNAVDSGNAVFLEGATWRRLTLLPNQFLGAAQGLTTNTYQGQFLRSTSTMGLLRMQAGVFDTPLAWTSLPTTGATSAGGPGTRTNQHTRGVYSNAQWSRSAGKWQSLSVGVDLRHDAANIVEHPMTDYTDAATAADAINTYSHGEALNTGIYAQDQVTLTSRFTVTAGGRYDAWRSYDGSTQSSATSAQRSYDDRTMRAFTGKLAGVYAPWSGTTLRASAGTAFRTPTVFELYRDLLDTGTYLLGNPGLQPERMFAWEMGVRQNVKRAVAVDAAVYRNRIENLIYRGTDLLADPSGATRRMFNAGEGTTRGLELGSSERPLPWLTLRQSYTFTDALITGNSSVPASVGKRIPYVPRHAASGSVSVTRKRLGVTASERYQSAVFSSDTNADGVKDVPGSYNAFLLTDIAANLSLTRRLALQFTATNIFDHEYYMFYRAQGRAVMAGARIRY